MDGAGVSQGTGQGAQGRLQECGRDAGGGQGCSQDPAGHFQQRTWVSNGPQVVTATRLELSRENQIIPPWKPSPKSGLPGGRSSPWDPPEPRGWPCPHLWHRVPVGVTSAVGGTAEPQHCKNQNDSKCKITSILHCLISQPQGGQSIKICSPNPAQLLWLWQPRQNSSTLGLD